MGKRDMNHLSEEELLDTYYGELPEARREHLDGCVECRLALTRMSELLDEVRSSPVPERGPGYGREVWARLEPKLNASKPNRWTRWWVLGPAGVALLSAAFLGGRLTVRTHQPAAIRQATKQVNEPAQQDASGKGSERVFLAAMGDHLDRSEILLAQLLHANPGQFETAEERARARDLVEENRLLRATASRSGDQAHAALLDDLERVFLDIAHSPQHLSSEDVEELQRRIEKQGLLFKVRVTSTDARAKGQTL
ncbi:MAG: hypothetical protein JO051_14980 [Acidobacteriaceae bacterium]|nr:hypothetical protein [Acidobacteriaceae bacterium]